MTPNDYDVLLAYLHRDLPAEQAVALEARLKAEPTLADALVLLAREESILTEWAHSAAATLVETPRRAARSPSPIRTRRSRFAFAARWGAAAAAVALVIWGIFRMTAHNNRIPASDAAVVVESMQGDVTLETADGIVALADGQQLLPGLVRTVGEDSSAVLRDPDNNRFLLLAGTKVRVERLDVAAKGKPGQRVSVVEGQLTADIVRPMLLGTPHAEVSSSAGRFSCSSAPAATRVETEEGRVRFTRTSDGTSIEVRTGFYAVATDLPATAEEPFTPRSLTAALTVPRGLPLDVGGPVLAMALSPDGRTLVTGGHDGTLKFWDMATGTLRLAFKAHGGTVRHLEYSHDGRLLLTGSSDRRPKIFDAATGQEKLALRKHRTDVDGAALAPNARTIATVFSNNKEGGEVRFWQTATGQEIGSLSLAHTQVLTLDWSDDGALLALGCRDGSVRLFQVTVAPTADRATAQERHVLIGHAGEVRSLAFSSRGLVASAGVDGTARLWNVADGRELHVLTAHAREVRSVAFSDDGRFLVTSGNDSAARLWHAADGREILAVKVRKGAITRALLSPDGKTLVTAGMDRLVRLWDLEQERRAGGGAPPIQGSAVAFR